MFLKQLDLHSHGHTEVMRPQAAPESIRAQRPTVVEAITPGQTM
ncbi:hypothetical protein ACJ41O_010637 [Fusarium nematophilum]